MKMDNLIKRSFEIRATDTEKREVSGVAVPFNETIDIGGGWSERFDKGAIDLTSDVKLFRDHKEIIGRVTEMEESEEGLLIRAKISETTLGNETLNLVKDGAIRSFSVGFIPVIDEKENKTIVRKKVDLKEVSLVAFPAYENASVTEVREVKEEIMTENTDYSAEIAEVRNHAEELERRLDVLATTSVSTPAVKQFRSYGEYIKAVASGDTDAHRDYTGPTTADTIMKNAWVSDVLQVLNAGRPSWAVLSSAALPADGNNIEYPVRVTNGMDVAEQAAEGDTLAYGSISITSETAPIKTYGGYTNMSRQLVERSSVAYVDAAFRAMVAKYAAATNAAAKAKLIAATGFNTATVASWAADAVIEALADSAVKVNEDTGKALEFILCSADVFKDLAGIVDGSNRPLLSNQGATVNTLGSINPLGLTGNILGLPIVVDPSFAAGNLYVGNRSALTTYESAGAPFRLTDSDITNLTNTMSVYGYAAIGALDPQALVKVANPND
jgi:HK97 family phage prohead protease